MHLPRLASDCNSCPVNPSLSPIASIFSVNKGGLGLDPSEWPTVWFKGGSEPGVLTLGYMATNEQGSDVRGVATVVECHKLRWPFSDARSPGAVVGAFGLDALVLLFSFSGSAIALSPVDWNCRKGRPLIPAPSR